jgi:hypothetical protein
MVLTAYHFDGDPDTLLEAHHKLTLLYPPNALDLHVAISHDGGITVFDACPDRATQKAFAASAEFTGALAQVGLPTPRADVLGDVHFATMNQSVIR